MIDLFTKKEADSYFNNNCVYQLSRFINKKFR